MELAEVIDFLAAKVRQRRPDETLEGVAARWWPTIMPQLSPAAWRTLTEHRGIGEAEFYRWLHAERTRLGLQRLLDSSGNC